MAAVNFARPWGWLWLCALIPVIILYFLRRKEREWPVSALFLWEGIRPDRPLFREKLRQRFDLLLVLQILAVILFAFSLSQPVVPRVRPSGATLLVLDGSASTSARGVPERILAAARQVVEGSAGPWAAVLWADPPTLLSGPTSSREEILQALSRYRPNLSHRPELAQALALLPEPWPRVVVITDRPPQDLEVETVVVERPENLAITAFSVRPTPDGTRYEAYVRVWNGQKRYCDVQVRVRSEAGEFWANRLLAPQEEEDVILPLARAPAQAFVAELRPSDDFPWDNTRYFAFSTRQLRVAWQGREERYLWAALRAAGSVVRAQKEADLVVAVDTDLVEEPQAALLLWAAGSSSAPRGEVHPAGPLRAAASPLLAHVEVERFRLREVYAVDLPAGTTVLLWAGDFPLLAVWEDLGGRRAMFAGNLETSNLPLLPDFPILIGNILRWLVPEEPAPLLQVGEAVLLPPGTEVVLDQASVTGLWVPQLPGLYQWRWSTGSGFLAVNVPWEAFGPSAPVPSQRAKTGEATRNQPLWPWIVMALGPLLLGEAILHERRGG